MHIESQLHIASHPDRDAEKGYSFNNGEPHAMGLIKIPFDQIEQHPRLKEIYEALPDDAKEFVKKEGNLPLSHDFSFIEDYKAGIGLIMTDLTLDIARLKDEEKTQIRDWLRDQYFGVVDLGGDTDTDAALQSAVEKAKPHIITDMTFAGMSRDYMVKAIEEHVNNAPEEDRECLVPPELMAKYFDSIKERIWLDGSEDFSPGSTNRQSLDAYYDSVLKMEDHWPSAKDENCGREEEPDQGRDIFFKGFVCAGEEIIKAGPYAYSCGWPANENFKEFDSNGVARDSDGNPIAPKDLEVDTDYVYVPNTVLAKDYEGDKAKAILDAFLDHEAPVYDGFGLNCASVSGQAVFGEDFDKIPDRGPKNDKLWNPDYVKELNDNGKLPEGMSSFAVDVQKVDRTVDQNALHAATKEVANQQAAMQKSGLSGMEKAAAVAALTAGVAAVGAGVKPGKPQQTNGQENGQQQKRSVFGKVAKVGAVIAGIGLAALAVTSLKRGESMGAVARNWVNFVTSKGNGGQQHAR